VQNQATCSGLIGLPMVPDAPGAICNLQSAICNRARSELSMATKVALVTGGGGGLGRAISLALAGKGAQVVVADIAEEAGAATARLVAEAGGEARFVRADVSDAESVARMVEAAVGWYGRLDYAINNAGVEGGRAPTASYPAEEWLRVIGINLIGVWQCMRHELPQMVEQGGGAIVNVASLAGLVGLANNSAYTASKHGVVGLTKAAALEYARQGIRVNALCPGYTRTPMVERVFAAEPRLEGQFRRAIPMGRIGAPEEIAAAALYLCEGAAFMTGQTLVLDGGISAQ
jgi:NAD(P)-dependent dehydrogenase (short-subunit alcohol dehydrogenase family)